MEIRIEGYIKGKGVYVVSIKDVWWGVIEYDKVWLGR